MMWRHLLSEGNTHIPAVILIGCSVLFTVGLTLTSVQFEIVSQHLVFANCIPLILKFFNQNIMSYISAKNR